MRSSSPRPNSNGRSSGNVSHSMNALTPGRVINANPTKAATTAVAAVNKDISFIPTSSPGSVTMLAANNPRGDNDYEEEQEEGINVPLDPSLAVDPKLLYCNLCLFIWLKAIGSYDSGAFSAALGAQNGIAEEWGLSLSMQGTLSSSVFLGNVIGCPLAGHLFSKYSEKKVLLVSLIFHAVFTLLFATFPEYTIALVNRFFIGITLAFIVVYTPVWVDEFAPKERQSVWMASHNAGVPVGIMLGYLLGAFFPSFTSISWSWAFYIKCVLMVPTIAYVAKVDSRSINTGSKASTTERSRGEVATTSARADNGSSPSGETIVATEARSFFNTVRHRVMALWVPTRPLLLNPIFMCSVIAMSSMYFVATGLQNFVTQYLRAPPFNASMQTVMAGFGAAVVTAPVCGVIVGGVLLDKCGGYQGNLLRVALFSVAWGSAAATFSVMCIFVSTTRAFLVVMSMVLFCGGAIIPSGAGLTMASLPPKLRSVGAAFSQTMYNLLGNFSGPLVCGWVAKWTGDLKYGIMMLLLSSLLGVGPMVVILLMAIRQKKTGAAVTSTVVITAGEEDDDDSGSDGVHGEERYFAGMEEDYQGREEELQEVAGRLFATSDSKVNGDAQSPRSRPTCDHRYSTRQHRSNSIHCSGSGSSSMHPWRRHNTDAEEELPSFSHEVDYEGQLPRLHAPTEHVVAADVGDDDKGEEEGGRKDTDAVCSMSGITTTTYAEERTPVWGMDSSPVVAATPGGGDAAVGCGPVNPSFSIQSAEEEREEDSRGAAHEDSSSTRRRRKERGTRPLSTSEVARSSPLAEPSNNSIQTSSPKIALATKMLQRSMPCDIPLGLSGMHADNASNTEGAAAALVDEPLAATHTNSPLFPSSIKLGRASSYHNCDSTPRSGAHRSTTSAIHKRRNDQIREADATYVESAPTQHAFGMDIVRVWLHARASSSDSSHSSGDFRSYNRSSRAPSSVNRKASSASVRGSSFQPSPMSSPASPSAKRCVNTEDRSYLDNVRFDEGEPRHPASSLPATVHVGSNNVKNLNASSSS